MPSPRINKDNNYGCYFMTFTIQHWYYLFDRHDRWNILADSLKYFIENKNLQLYGFVFMINHIHLLVSCLDVSGFIRDFKKFTAKELKKNIMETEPAILKLFITDNVYHFWQQTNMPISIETEKVFIQKLEYIHFNPVKKHYVEKPDYWYWSSANNSCELQTLSWV